MDKYCYNGVFFINDIVAENKHLCHNFKANIW